LVLDRSHLMTNRHVVEAGHTIDVDSSGVSRPCWVHAHQHIDVAVIEVELNDNEQFFTLDGMVFREPAWADDVYLLGYPRVPMTTEEAITLQRGEVVNPSIETSATGAAPLKRHSCTRRSHGRAIAAAPSSPSMAG
jgi:hypothetical protein